MTVKQLKQKLIEIVDQEKEITILELSNIIQDFEDEEAKKLWLENFNEN